MNVKAITDSILEGENIQEALKVLILNLQLGIRKISQYLRMQRSSFTTTFSTLLNTGGKSHPFVL